MTPLPEIPLYTPHKARIIMRVVSLWDCGDPDHGHTREATALRCIQRQANKAKRQEHAKVIALMWEMRQAKNSLAVIGDRFGYSGRYVSATLRYHRDQLTGGVKKRKQY